MNTLIDNHVSRIKDASPEMAALEASIANYRPCSVMPPLSGSLLEIEGIQASRNGVEQWTAEYTPSDLSDALNLVKREAMGAYGMTGEHTVAKCLYAKTYARDGVRLTLRVRVSVEVEELLECPFGGEGMPDA